MGVGVTDFSPGVLRQLMASREMTSKELAARVGVAASAVSGWLTATSAPTPPVLLRIAAALDVTPAALTPDVIGREKLADLRAHAGLTHTMVAPALGIGTTLIGVIERGRKGIYPHLVEPMAKLYNVSVDDVIAAWNRTTVPRPNRWADSSNSP